MGLASGVTFDLLCLQRKNGEPERPVRVISSTGKLGFTDLEPVGPEMCSGDKAAQRQGWEPAVCQLSPHAGEAGNYRTPGSEFPCSLEDIGNCLLTIFKGSLTSETCHLAVE